MKQEVNKDSCTLSSVGYLTSDNIYFKFINNKLVGKRAVYTHDLKVCWLEDVLNEDEIKIWWHGKDGDYDKIFEWNEDKARN